MSAEPRALRTILIGGFVLSLLSSCESSSQTVATNPQSRLRLSADELTPLAGCQPSSNDPTDMTSYVATLIDVTPDEDDRIDPKAVVSGPPTRCTSSVTFSVSAERGELEVGSFYVALVDGYVQSGLEATKANSRTVSAGGAVVTPSWQWLCSFGALPKAALSDVLDIARELAVTSPEAPPTDAGSISPTDAQPDAAEAQDASADSSASDDAASRDSAVVSSSATTTGDETSNPNSGLESSNASGATGDAGSPPSPEPALSTLETLLEIAEDPTTPIPAELVQSHLGTLRGCVALP